MRKDYIKCKENAGNSIKNAKIGKNSDNHDYFEVNFKFRGLIYFRLSFLLVFLLKYLKKLLKFFYAMEIALFDISRIVFYNINW